jgi:hypothetical protein
MYQNWCLVSLRTAVKKPESCPDIHQGLFLFLITIQHCIGSPWGPLMLLKREGK